MLDKAKQYLEENLHSTDRFLLGLSGGPDSIALFALLLQKNIPFAVCHVNHGWRGESQKEAEILAQMCEKNEITFHLAEIEDFDFEKNNIEDRFRRERYKFFNALYKRGKYTALLLGHHGDDQAETVLKRVLEGSSLINLGAMDIEAEQQGMRIIRPLLFHTKKEIYQFLKEEKFTFFEDHTNHDMKYLRAKMRNKIIPTLEKQFGKNIVNNLNHLAIKTKEVEGFFYNRLKKELSSLKKGQLGAYLPLPKNLQLIEMEYFIRFLCKSMGLTFSRKNLELMQLIIKDKKSGKKIVQDQFEIIYDRNYLFFHDLKASADVYCEEVTEKPTTICDWKKLWEGGTGVLYLPHKQCYLASPDLSKRLPNGITLKKWYVQHDVPAFLRHKIPVVWDNNQIVGECLTGKQLDLYPNQLLTLITKRI